MQEGPLERVRRSVLFMPGSSWRILEKGGSTGADAAILDLEDAVAPEKKGEARNLVARALRTVVFGATERIVRINLLDGPYGRDDLVMAMEGHPEALLLPKVNSFQDVLRLEGLLLAEEKRLGLLPGKMRLMAMIETPSGVLAARDIACSSSRLEALVFGHADLAAELGIRPGRAGEGVIQEARALISLAASAAGVQAIDAVFLDLEDLEGLRKEAEAAAMMGYSGKLCIHPRQIAPIHEAFTPTEEEVSQAQQVLAAFKEARKKGQGVLVLEGKMVDEPIVKQASRVLARARRAGLLSAFEK
ncbi:MAG: CoA ester lyase [candidate division NC10 bacterium]|nr:CoA ester lyase [candidate division NC10 bacterium]